MFEIKRTSPEAEGIPSKAIFRFIKKLEKNKIPMHSILILRHGKLVAEGYYRPYERDTLHRMFSVTKSFTSLAIGLLEQDGKIRLSDSICQYFPEYLPGKVHPWLAEMTIEDMLQMRSCHNFTTYNKVSTTENWVRSFFQKPPAHRPGTIFMYDTSASHTLCALVEKLTGQDMLSFLKDRFLRRIGFSEHSYIIKDPFGTSMGGSGLMACPEDLAKVGLLLMNHGKDPAFYKGGSVFEKGQEETMSNEEGEQLYPYDYIARACSFQVSPAVNRSSKEGYGYQIWLLPHNGYAFCGLGEQLLLCYPEEDMIIVTTADTQGMAGGADSIYRAVEEELFAALSEKPLEVCEKDKEELRVLLASLQLPVLAEKQVDKRPARLFDDMMYSIQGNAADFRKMGIHTQGDCGVLKYCLKGEWMELPFGIGHLEESTFSGYGQRCVSSGKWLDDNTLWIVSWLIDECVASVSFKLYFTEEALTVYMVKTEETKFTEYQGFINS